MTAVENGLHAAALVLEEDIRKMDAGKIRATPEQRAFLMGAKNALMRSGAAETGGYPVDPTEPAATVAAVARKAQGTDSEEPQNLGLADR